MCVKYIEFAYLYDFSIECWNCSDSVLYICSFYYRLWKKTQLSCNCLKEIWLWSSSVIKIVKMKYNRINIKWWLVSTSFKNTLTFFQTYTSRSRSFIRTLFHSSMHFFPVLVKGLYQTESYSLHVLQLIRI
jgi:hypothetical protein